MMVGMAQVQRYKWYKLQGTHGTLQGRSVPKKNTTKFEKNTTKSIELVVLFPKLVAFFYGTGIPVRSYHVTVPYRTLVQYRTVPPYNRTVPPYRTSVLHRRTHSVPTYQVMVPHYRTHTVSFFQKPYLAPFLGLDKIHLFIYLFIYSFTYHR